MKKQLFILFLCIIFLCFLFFPLIPEGNGAIVSDECVACHGLYPGMEKAILLGNILCVNCHTNSDRETIKILGGVRVPIVYNTAPPVRPLAGGNFHYVAKDFGDRKGHNVDGVTSADEKFRGVPPGYDRTSDPSAIGYTPEKTLKCAGSNGCHGNRNIEDPFESISGTHHADDTPKDGSTTAKSYRFLRNAGKVKGVLGLEDDEWNRNNSSKKHNEYSPSIDLLCASCHGDFHSKDKTGKARPWFRHPTDIVLPKSGEYANYNPDFLPLDMPDIRIYNPDAPVGRGKVPELPGGEVTLGEDIVICLSCHVAHSSPYASILRWDYDAIIAGEEGKGGCFICHTGKGE
ncbi:MAG: cytochrome c3 family protein [Nitrospirota bacterium]